MRHTIAASATLAAFLTLLALPLTSAGQSTNVVNDLLGGVNKTLNRVGGNVQQLVAPKKRGAAPQTAPQVQQRAASPPGYTPPLHGTNPHGQGGLVIGDLSTTGTRPLGGNPSGSDSGEEVVVGRSRAEQQADGSYRSHITIVGLLGNELVGVDAGPGETRAGPLDAVQQGLLTPLCNATSNSVCLDVLRADVASTSSSGSATFSVASASVGPNGSVAKAGVAQSDGRISTDATCQTARGDTNTTNATVLGAITADVIQSSSESRACNDGSQSQTQSGNVLALNGTGVPIPTAQGCANGTPNTTGLIPGVAEIVCNADDANGAQAGAPYGVREALSAFVLGTVLKATTGASESRAVAPPATPAVNPPGGNGGNGNGNGNGNNGGNKSDNDNGNGNGNGAGNRPERSDGIDNDGDGKVDFPADPGCSSPADDSEANGAQTLAFTGTNLLLTLLIGALVVLAGLRLREATGRLERGTAR